MVKLNTGESKILELIKRNQPVSKYQLFKISNYYSYSAVWNIVKILSVQGLITEEKGFSKNGMGVVFLKIKE